MIIAPGSVCALILAGRRSSDVPDPVAASAGLPVKAFVAINGRPMIERVISALKECPEIGEICICLPDDVDVAEHSPYLAAGFASGGLLRVSPASSPSASVREFVSARVERQPVLATTADHPLLTPAMVRQFLGAFARSGAEAAVALTDADRIGDRYPSSRRTKLKFADGRFTGCNLFGFHGAGALHVLEFWRHIEQHRKQPWKLAHALGWSTLVLYLLGKLSVTAAVARLGHRCGSRLQAVLLDDLHAGIDVDKIVDLELVTSIIRSRENSRSDIAG